MLILNVHADGKIRDMYSIKHPAPESRTRLIETLLAEDFAFRIKAVHDRQSTIVDNVFLVETE